MGVAGAGNGVSGTPWQRCGPVPTAATAGCGRALAWARMRAGHSAALEVYFDEADGWEDYQHRLFTELATAVNEKRAWGVRSRLPQATALTRRGASASEQRILSAARTFLHEQDHVGGTAPGRMELKTRRRPTARAAQAEPEPGKTSVAAPKGQRKPKRRQPQERPNAGRMERRARRAALAEVRGEASRGGGCRVRQLAHRRPRGDRMRPRFSAVPAAGGCPVPVEPVPSSYARPNVPIRCGARPPASRDGRLVPVAQSRQLLPRGRADRQSFQLAGGTVGAVDAVWPQRGLRNADFEEEPQVIGHRAPYSWHLMADHSASPHPPWLGADLVVSRPLEGLAGGEDSLPRHAGLAQCWVPVPSGRPGQRGTSAEGRVRQ